jgi:hypothetical protein
VHVRGSVFHGGEMLVHCATESAAAAASDCHL